MIRGSDFQPVYFLAADQVPLDDLVDILLVDEGIPGGLRVDDANRAGFATVKIQPVVRRQAANR